MHLLHYIPLKNAEEIYTIEDVIPLCGLEVSVATVGKKATSVRLVPEGENLPATLVWKGNVPTGKMTLLKGNKRVKYRVDGDRVEVTLPAGMANEPVALQFTVKK